MDAWRTGSVGAPPWPDSHMFYGVFEFVINYTFIESLLPSSKQYSCFVEYSHGYVFFTTIYNLYIIYDVFVKL